MINEHFWKFNEGGILKEVEEYLLSTYNGHYTSEGGSVQTIDLIHSIGDSESFCRSNAIKYLSRFKKKQSVTPKSDLLKAIHYCFLLYHFSDCDKPSNNNYINHS
jgi:hypothetical protein